MNGPPVGVLDGGTTRTRLRLWDGQAIRWAGERAVGARDVAARGRGVLFGAVAALVSEARAVHGPFPLAGAGMLTGNLGLHDLPHLSAPVRWEALVAGGRPTELPDVGVIHLVPGVRSGGDASAPDDLLTQDVLRGEEVEVWGLRERLKLRGPARFMHYGSHHKVIWTDDLTLHGSATSLGGELLAALCSATVLAGSTGPLRTLEELDPAYWRAGWQAGLAHGLSRAAFGTRLAQLRLGATPDQALAYLLGVVSAGDLGLLEDSGPLDASAPLFLYGRPAFTRPVAAWLRDHRPHLPVTVVPEETAVAAGLSGTVHLALGGTHA